MANHETESGVEPARPRPRSLDPPVPPRAAPIRSRLLRLSYRYLWNWHDAEDVVQDALTVAHQRRGQLKDREKWFAWVYRIVIQRSLLHRRKTARATAESADLDGLPRNEVSAVGERIESDELREILTRLVADLPERQRTALRLRHLEEKSYRQIAQDMGIAESTARAHVRAAREELRNRILLHHPDWAPDAE